MKLRRDEMTEEQKDMWKQAPTKEEWVNWGMANRAAIALESDELTGADLNEAVAKCEGIVHTRYNGYVVDQGGNPLMYDDDWSLAGEIIEREGINLDNYAKNPQWSAWTPAPERESGEAQAFGPTPLIAAMRCYVASKQGEMK
jgi:hypothetical protein